MLPLFNVCFFAKCHYTRDIAVRPVHFVQWRRVGAEGCPRAPAEGAPKRGAVLFCDTKLYVNYVISVEAKMGMEGQFICVEQCTF